MLQYFIKKKINKKKDLLVKRWDCKLHDYI